MVSRRQLLAIAAATLTATTGLVAWRFIQGSDADAIVSVLRKRLGYLILDEAGLRAFAQELTARKMVSSSRLRLLDFAGPIYTQLIPSRGTSWTHELQHGEERIVSLYLLASDFFLNGADETKTVRYRRFYDPLNNPDTCSNPFSRPLTS